MHQDKRVLAIDVCPQANMSELFLGGLEGDGGKSLLLVQGGQLRATIGGYFQLRLPNPYSLVDFTPTDFVVKPSKYNSSIPNNIDLLSGDPLLELQSNAMVTLANTQIPGVDTWASVISWLRNFLELITDKYDTVFLDLNPSFSIYTQIALAATDRIVVPVMADDSSRRAIQNAFSLIFGIKLPSEIYAKHMFNTKMEEGKLALPKVHRIIKNRITQYMGPASGYSAVLNSIDADMLEVIKERPDTVTFSKISEAIVEVKDFQTTGVVAFARGTPFFALQTGKLSVGDRRVQVNKSQLTQCIDAVNNIIVGL